MANFESAVYVSYLYVSVGLLVVSANRGRHVNDGHRVTTSTIPPGDGQELAPDCSERNQCLGGIADLPFHARNCFCDPACQVYGDCCRDYEIALGRRGSMEGDISANLIPHSIRSLLTCSRIEDIDRSYEMYIVDRCPKGYKDTSVRDKCRNEQETEVFYRLPVTGRTSGVLYRNVYCAICAGDYDFIFWEVLYTCIGNEDVADWMLNNNNNNNSTTQLNIDRADEFRRLISSTTCSMELNPPPERRPRKCKSHISKCPPKWKDERIANKCKNYTDYVYHDLETFKNKHCAQCNRVDESLLSCEDMRTPWVEIEKISDIDGEPNSIASARIVYDFNTGNAIVRRGETPEAMDEIVFELGLCPRGRVYDIFADECRMVGCIGGICTTQMPTQSSTTSDHIVIVEIAVGGGNMRRKLTTTTTRSMHRSRHRHKSSSSPVASTTTAASTVTTSQAISERRALYAANTSLAAEATNHTTLTTTLATTYTANTSPLPTTATTIQPTTTEATTTTTFITTEALTSTSSPTTTTFPKTFAITIATPTTTTKEFSTNVDTNVTKNLIIINPMDYGTSTKSFEIVGNKDEIQKTVSSLDMKEKLDIGESTEYSAQRTKLNRLERVTATTKAYIEEEDEEDDDGDDDDDFFGSRELKNSESSSHKQSNCSDAVVVMFIFTGIQNRVAFICTLISMACLLVSFITILVLPSKWKTRSNVLLCLIVSIFLGQLLFLLALPSSQAFFPRVVCYWMGAIMHYFITAIFIWMSVLAFEFCVTVMSNRLHRKDHCGRFLCYSLYAWLTPLAIVIACLVVDFFQADHLLIRPCYGECVCFITGRSSLLITMVLPAAILSLISLFLYFLSASHICSLMSSREIAKTASTDQTQAGSCRLAVYIFLTLLIIVTWIIGFVATFFPTPDDLVVAIHSVQFSTGTIHMRCFRLYQESVQTADE